MASKKWNVEAIKASHVVRAAKFFRIKGSYAPFHDARAYYVVIGGAFYPPKAISSKAHEFATEKALKPSDFGGAKNGTWHRRLRELGFPIVEKGSTGELNVKVSKSLKGSRAQRLKRLKDAAGTSVQIIDVRVSRFVRNPDVVAERLFLARGKCDRCKKKAPFLRLRDKTPYLEVHHVEPLANGGADTVGNTTALCPNCHAQTHDELRLEGEVE